MRLIDSQKLKNNIVGIPSADEPSNYANCDVHIAYLNGKAQRQIEILELIDKQKEVKNTSEGTAATTKKKRKFRAMTNMEFHDFYCCKHLATCQSDNNFDCTIRFICRMQGLCAIKNEPYKTKDGKYILVEVTNDA